MTTPAAATAKPATAPATQPVEEPEEIRVWTGYPDDMDSTAVELGLAGDELNRYRAALRAQRLALEAWDASDAGRAYKSIREQIQKSRTQQGGAGLADLRAKMTELGKPYWDLRNATRLDVLRTLSPENLRQTAARSLATKVTRQWSSLGLSDEQRVKLREVILATIPASYSMAQVESDPYFRELESLIPAIRESARSQVLTDEQRARLDKPATRPAQ